MSFSNDSSGYKLKPLGYDLRLIGVHADEDRLRRGIQWRPDLVPASYDSNVASPMFVSPGEAADPFQIEIDPRQISDSYFITFGLFRSTREAISFIPDRDYSRNFQLWYFSLVWPQYPPSGIFSGILNAMQGENVVPPDLPAERLGYEVLDGDGASITHTYYGVHEMAGVDVTHLGAEADRLASAGHWLLAIDRIMHLWWLPGA